MKSELEFHLRYDIRYTHTEKIPREGIYSTRHHKDCVDTFPSAVGIPSSWAACSALPALVAHTAILHAQRFENPICTAGTEPPVQCTFTP